MLSLGFTKAFHLSSIAAFVFFTTLLVYNGQRYYKLNFTDVLTITPRIDWMRNNKKLVESVLASAIIGVLLYGLPLLMNGIYTFSIISICTLISVFYVVKIGKRNLREVPGLKVFLITIVYFIIIFILPFESWFAIKPRSQSIFWIFFFFLVFQYLYILGITILFDIPDLKNDSDDLKTFAQRFGVRQTIVISVVLISPLLLFLVLRNYSSMHVWILLAIHFPFYLYLIKRSNRHFYLSFFGEGILGLLGVYYYLI